MTDFLSNVGYGSVAAIMFGLLLLLNHKLGDMVRNFLKWAFGNGSASKLFNWRWFGSKVASEQTAKAGKTDWNELYVQFTNGWALFVLVLVFDLHGMFARWLVTKPGLFTGMRGVF